jgi:hypothetical protein
VLQVLGLWEKSMSDRGVLGGLEEKTSGACAILIRRHEILYLAVHTRTGDLCRVQDSGIKAA